MRIEVSTPPATEPVTMAEVKAQIGRDVNNATYDTELNGYIKAARVAAEAYTQRAIINQVWHVHLDAWPHDRKYREPWWDGVRQGAVSALYPTASVYTLPGGVLQNVVQIVSIDADDVETVFAAARYYVDTTAIPGRIALKSGWSWPTTNRPINGLRIEQTVGWTDESEVPQQFKQGMLWHIQSMWESRGYQEEDKERTATLPDESAEIYSVYVMGDTFIAAGK